MTGDERRKLLKQFEELKKTIEEQQQREAAD